MEVCLPDRIYIALWQIAIDIWVLELHNMVYSVHQPSGNLYNRTAWFHRPAVVNIGCGQHWILLDSDPSSFDNEPSQLSVSAYGYISDIVVLSTGMAHRHKAYERGQLPWIVETWYVIYLRQNGHAGDLTNARYAYQISQWFLKAGRLRQRSELLHHLQLLGSQVLVLRYEKVQRLLPIISLEVDAS